MPRVTPGTLTTPSGEDHKPSHPRMKMSRLERQYGGRKVQLANEDQLVDATGAATANAPIMPVAYTTPDDREEDARMAIKRGIVSAANGGATPWGLAMLEDRDIAALQRKQAIVEEINDDELVMQCFDLKKPSEVDLVAFLEPGFLKRQEKAIDDDFELGKMINNITQFGIRRDDPDAPRKWQLVKDLLKGRVELPRSYFRPETKNLAGMRTDIDLAIFHPSRIVSTQSAGITSYNKGMGFLSWGPRDARPFTAGTRYGSNALDGSLIGLRPDSYTGGTHQLLQNRLGRLGAQGGAVDGANRAWNAAV